MDALKEKTILQDKETRFKFEDLELKLQPNDEPRIRMILNNYFIKHENESYSVSLVGIVTIILEHIRRSVREIFYEDLINQVRETLSMILPASVLYSYEESELAIQTESAIMRVFMVADNQEYNGPANTYLPKNVMAVSADTDLMTEIPLER